MSKRWLFGEKNWRRTDVQEITTQFERRFKKYVDKQCASEKYIREVRKFEAA